MFSCCRMGVCVTSLRFQRHLRLWSTSRRPQYASWMGDQTGHGIPPAKMQRAERNKIPPSHQIQLSTERPHPRATRQHKYLGVDLHSSLSWKNHFDRISKKANSMLGFLRRNLRSCKEDNKANAYFTMVRSNLEYCSSVWNPHHKDQVHKLEMVQRMSARFTTNKYRNTSSVSSMLDHLQWESLEARRSKIQLTLFIKWSTT